MTDNRYTKTKYFDPCTSLRCRVNPDGTVGFSGAPPFGTSNYSGGNVLPNGRECAIDEMQRCIVKIKDRLAVAETWLNAARRGNWEPEASGALRK